MQSASHTWILHHSVLSDLGAVIVSKKKKKCQHFRIFFFFFSSLWDSRCFSFLNSWSEWIWKTGFNWEKSLIWTGKQIPFFLCLHALFLSCGVAGRRLQVFLVFRWLFPALKTTPALSAPHHFSLIQSWERPKLCHSWTFVSPGMESAESSWFVEIRWIEEGKQRLKDW